MAGTVFLHVFTHAFVQFLPVMDVNVDEVCPTCFGKGTVKSSFLFTDVLESKISTMANKLGIKNFTLHVHPYVAAYINQGIVSLKRKWQVKYGFGLKVKNSHFCNMCSMIHMERKSI